MSRRAPRLEEIMAHGDIRNHIRWKFEYHIELYHSTS